MSLKAFHLVFIAASVILALFFAAWAVREYQRQQEAAYLGAGAASLAGGIALALYGTAFQKKTKRM
jgi:hypothetical protein